MSDQDLRRVSFSPFGTIRWTCIHFHKYYFNYIVLDLFSSLDFNILSPTDLTSGKERKPRTLNANFNV